jgi:hypothetical protein
MARRYSTISVLTDYGTADEFVGVVRSVLRSIAPDVAVVDVTHEIPPHDVRAGGLLLARAAQYLVPGVVLAVVDPGVGTDRRAVAVEVGDGASVLVGPDNGLLAPAVAMVGGATRAVELTATELHLPAPGPTFDGRDVFAPAAAHLCNGLDLLEVGTEIDPAGLRPGILPVAREEDGGIAADVLWVDRFGNCQLNVDPDDVADWGDRIRVRIGDDTRVATRARAFADLGTNEVGLLVDSYGLLALVVDRASAAEELRIDEGDAITLVPIPDDEPAPGTTSPVTLRSRP